MSKRRVGGVIKVKERTQSKQKQQENLNEEWKVDAQKSEQAKESAKNLSSNKKQGKIAAKQAHILLKIENENTTKYIKELCNKFEPPVCKKCTNRNADRICVCSECKDQDYLSLICGKCHIVQHKVSQEKNELDVEEFFIKLSTFLNETKLNTSLTEQGINVEQLSNSIRRIAQFQVLLDEIQETFRRKISDYQSLEEIENKISSNVSKCLSEPTFGNIQEQLIDISSAVVFENNGFRWNEMQDKLALLRNQASKIENEQKQLKQDINNLFLGRKIDLSQLEIKDGIKCNQKLKAKIDFNEDNQIIISTLAQTQSSQFYLDYEFDPSMKYTMRFTIQNINSNYLLFGLMKKEQAISQYYYSGYCNFLFKRFRNSCPTQDCSKVLQGQLFGDQAQQGDSYEMRFCIQDQILEFSTLPNNENVVSKLDCYNFEVSQIGNYVVTFSLYNNVAISIDSLEENFFFPSY